MWLERIQKYFQNKEYSHFNNRLDLHFAIFVKELLQNKIHFEIVGKDLKINRKIKKEKKEMSKDQFFYWWQINRYNEVYEEEMKLIQSFEKIKATIQKLRSSLPNNDSEEAEKKLFEMNMNINKLTNHLQKEEPKVKEELKLLSSFRNSCPNRDSFDKLLQSIQIILKYSSSGS